VAFTAETMRARRGTDRDPSAAELCYRQNTVMNTDSSFQRGPSNVVGAALPCLEDSESYVALDKRNLFVRKWGRGLALGPFVVALIVDLGVLPRAAPDTHFWEEFGYAVIWVSLAWTGIVIVYSLSVLLRWLFFRCPRCGWRFGPGEECRSCSLPRSRRAAALLRSN
jgi:hypothetical protein